MKFEYRPSGVCSRSIYLDIENGVIKDVEFVGGCNGNLKGICSCKRHVLRRSQN